MTALSSSRVSIAGKMASSAALRSISGNSRRSARWIADSEASTGVTRRDRIQQIY